MRIAVHNLSFLCRLLIVALLPLPAMVDARRSLIDCRLTTVVILLVASVDVTAAGVFVVEPLMTTVVVDATFVNSTLMSSP